MRLSTETLFALGFTPTTHRHLFNVSTLLWTQGGRLFIRCAGQTREVFA